MHIKKYMALLDDNTCGNSVNEVQITVEEQIIKWSVLRSRVLLVEKHVGLASVMLLLLEIPYY